MPDRLGKYELRGVLGKGAMGVVYDAWDPGIERRVAIKTIRLPAGDEGAEETYARFKREAQAAGRLSHPGIIAVYDSGEAEGVAYIVMELVEGQSLKDLLDREHRLLPDAAVRIMRGLLDALAYSHGCGVIHRDIKPTNIMLTDAGSVKIADFGIARIENSSMTQVGTVMGTPAYMSPEQFMGQAVDARTDLYACGVVLYQLLTGERPFEGGLTAIMHKVLHTDPPRPSELSVTAPAALDPVVARAMARRPEERFASAAAFSGALAAAMQARPAEMVPRDAAPGGAARGDAVPDDATTVLPRAAVPAAPVRLASPQAARRTGLRRTPALWGGTAAVLLLAAGAAWVLLRPAAPPQQMVLATPAVAGGRTPDAPATPARPPALDQPTPTLSPPQPAPAPVPPATVVTILAPGATPSAQAIPAVPTPAAPAIGTAAPVLANSSLPVPAVPSPGPSPEVLAVLEPPRPPASFPRPAVLEAALRDMPCTAVEAAIAPDGRITATGLAGAGAPDAAARAAVEAAAGQRGKSADWQVVRFDGPYCGVVDLLRWIKAGSPPGAELDFTLRGGRTRFRNLEVIAPVITVPAFPGHLRLSYFQNKGNVDHLYPAGGSPDQVLKPGAPVPLGDPRTGGWEVGDPFGTDMMLAVMSSVALPMPPRPGSETSESYLAVLRRAIEAARRDGATVLARVVVVQTQP